LSKFYKAELQVDYSDVLKAMLTSNPSLMQRIAENSTPKDTVHNGCNVEKKS
jgi:hypothetical protein